MKTEDMRERFAATLIELAKEDPDIVLINSDSKKYSGTASFETEFPDRSFNVGIAEANMVSVAAGMASFGKVPFVTSFTSFASRRCFDQVTISWAYSGLHGVMVGANPGVASELNGGTHMSFEDIGIYRTIPRMVILEPCDAIELAGAMHEIVKLRQPVYLRLFRGKAPVLHADDFQFHIGRGEVMMDGSDVTLISYGMTVSHCMEAAEKLKADHISARVLNLCTIKPIDADLIVKAAQETKKLVTVDNHNVIGGIGSAVAEVVTSSDCPVQVRRLGVQDRFGEVGKLPYLEKVFGLDPDSIADSVRDFLKK